MESLDDAPEWDMDVSGEVELEEMGASRSKGGLVAAVTGLWRKRTPARGEYVFVGLNQVGYVEKRPAMCK